MILMVWILGAAALAWYAIDAATGLSTFLSGFAALVDRPEIRRGFLNYVSGRSYLVGEFGGRKLTVLLQFRVGKYSGPGYLLIAMETTVPRWLDHSAFEDHARDRQGKLALSALKARHDLELALRDNCVKARWQPIGFFIFPGRFEPEKWRTVLEQMHALAGSLERDESDRAGAARQPA
jgi:hypothetical protein